MVAKAVLAYYRKCCICVLVSMDIPVPYMVLHGGAIGHAMEGGIKSCEIGWEEFCLCEMKCGSVE